MEPIVRNKSKIIVINISENNSLILYNSFTLVNISPVVLDLITSKGRLKIWDIKSGITLIFIFLLRYIVSSFFNW